MCSYNQRLHNVALCSVVSTVGWNQMGDSKLQEMSGVGGILDLYSPLFRRRKLHYIKGRVYC